MPDAPGLELIAQSINEVRDGTVTETSFEHDRAALIVDPEGVLEALRWLRETEGQGYTFLSSLHAADYLPATPRFAVHYELLCRERVERIRVKALLSDPAAGKGSPRVERLRLPRTGRCLPGSPASSSSRPPSSRSARPTTSSGSSSGAIRICAGS